MPLNVSGHEVVRNIISVAHSFGSVKQFKAYLNMSISLTFPTLRSQLQTSGVSLTDCPSNRENDAADNMLLGQSSKLKKLINPINLIRQQST